MSKVRSIRVRDNIDDLEDVGLHKKEARPVSGNHHRRRAQVIAKKTYCSAFGKILASGDARPDCDVVLPPCRRALGFESDGLDREDRLVVRELEAKALESGRASLSRS